MLVYNYHSLKMLEHQPTSRIRQIVPPTDQGAAILNNALLIDGQKAAPAILEKVADFPIRRIVVFGEPGANKTTILLQLATAMTQQDPSIKPQYLFYDSALARYRQETGTTEMQSRDHQAVSNRLTREMEATFKPKPKSDGKRPIQFVELVGMSKQDRGISTLRKAAARTANISPIEKDTLAIGIVADPRSLRDAGEVRQRVRDLANPQDVYGVLRDYRIFISRFNQGVSYKQMAERIVEFFRNMAPPHKIEEVHREVMSQARQRSEEDEYRLFKQLRLPNLAFPISDTTLKTEYLLSLSFMQTHMADLGLVADPLSPTPDYLRDSGLTIFSPYNPRIPKVLDLTQVLESTRT